MILSSKFVEFTDRQPFRGKSVNDRLIELSISKYQIHFSVPALRSVIKVHQESKKYKEESNN